MELVGEYRDTLLRLQGAWDTLALLGQMSAVGAEISQTRDSFHRLTETLLDSLACQLLRQRLNGLRGKAQVAIDILVRNLFERTADVGFLATDAALCEFVTAHAAQASDSSARSENPSGIGRNQLQARFAAYVAKYSVYDDIVVLAPDGQVLARLDEAPSLAGIARCSHPMVAAALGAGVPYVEIFGASDLLGDRCGLLYLAAIAGAGGAPAGVLCLSFRFDDELRAIFARLLDDDDDTVLTLTDARGAVIASSDSWQVALGAALPPPQPGAAALRFAGREYLHAAARSAGYQGYSGPGWQAQALLPVEFAFRVEPPRNGGASGPANDGLAALARRLDTREIFDAQLRAIPLQAQQIQRDLARSVWNGKLSRRPPVAAAAGQAAVAAAGAVAGAPAAAFATTFLQEVSRTGMQIRDVFETAIARLQTGAIAAILDESRFHASLAIDIMDRNLYERANDCRWWALTSALRQALTAPDATSSQHAAEVLRHINHLYTVYTLLVLFDTRGRVVAVSDPARSTLVGSALDPDLVQATLALRDPQHYHVGPHLPSELYGGAPTYVYAAAVHPHAAAGAEGAAGAAGVAGAAIGGVAIVFDGAAQFAAMLHDALPRGADGAALPGAIGLFVTRSGRVVASTDARFAPGCQANFLAGLLDRPHGATGHQVIDIGGAHYAAGVAQGSGYREYHRHDPVRPDSADDVAAVILLRLGQLLPHQLAAPAAFEPSPLQPAPDGPGSGTAGAERQEIAGFSVAGQWFGLHANDVEAVLGLVAVVALPNAPPHAPGLVKYRDKVVPVLDLAAHLQLGTAAVDGPLLLCRTSRGQRVALRVDTLGGVWDIDARQLKACQAQAGAPPLQLLSGRSGTAAAILTVLSLDTLWPAIGTEKVA